MSADPYKYFRIEARELVDRMQQNVLEIERSTGAGEAAAEIIRGLLRAAHTLKGAARAVRQPQIADHAHAIEDALEAYRETGGVPRPVTDTLWPRLDDMDRLVRALGRPPEAAAAAPPPRPVAAAPGRGAAPAAGAVPPDLAPAAAPPPIAAPAASAAPPDPAPTAASPQVAAPAASTAPASSSAASAPAGGVAAHELPRAVRAEIGELDALQGGVGEARAALATLRRIAGELEQVHRLAGIVADQLAPGPGSHAVDGVHASASELRRRLDKLERGLGGAIAKLDRELGEVHDAVEQLRLVPVTVLFTVLERVARDAGRALGRDLVFERRGGEVRLDGDVLAAVQPALVQLVRNAVAHGIEPAAERERAGKPAAGRVAIEIERHARRVTFRCGDDGRGLDVGVLREVAVRRGVTPSAARAMTADELVQLLLRGGISTSSTVTEIAGRGIGLDVVRDAAARLGGTVQVTSSPGVSTVFALEVPVSLAALDALALDDAGVVATIPLDAVRRALRVFASELTATPEGPAITVDGEVLPFLPLGAVLGRGTPVRAGVWSAVVIEDRGRRVVLGAGRLLRAETIVVRPLPELAPCDPVIAGASLDADGNPQLVLDPAGLVATRARALAEPDVHRPRILVVDDSVTTRMLEQSILEAAGYQVDLAVSGEDGLARARATRYALFLVDVEMPGIDGFTFVESVQRDPALRDTPAILVTSRASPADRARGREVGARGYIAKGEFDQGALLEQIARQIAPNDPPPPPS